MRFSLRTLMLLFPLLIAAYGLASFLNGNFGRSTYVERKWKVELVQLRALQTLVNDPGGLPWKGSKQARFAALQDALNPQPNTPAMHPSFESLITTDCWEQPYRCVCLDERDQVVDESRLVKIGIYSVGEDGVSQTNGNDPDDLNSWSLSDDFYQQRHAERETRERRLQTLAYMPVSLGVFGLVWWFLKPFSARSLEWERSRGRHDF